LAPTLNRLALDGFGTELEAGTALNLAVAQAAVERLRAAGADASAAVPIGDAAAEIVDEATRWGADLIVLGSRGLTGVSRILLGSVARNVLQASTTSILVVREPGNADGASRA
jgi:nucleotide-binding universal stress UspA family protein